MNSKNTIFIRGNHDYTLFGKLSYTFVENDRVVHVTHGFQNDKGMTNPFARLGVWLVGWVEKVFPNIENVFSTSKLGDDIVKNTTAYATTLLKTGKYDQVVLGHTHNKGEFKCGAYLNCGTCQHGKFDYIIIGDKDEN